MTQTLAQLVASHPSRGWSDAVDLEAHRTQMNWVGCAVGAASHETAQAALAAVQLLQPAPQASVLGRSERVDMASAALINGISSQETRLTNASFITKSSRFFANAGCRQGPGMLRRNKKGIVTRVSVRPEPVEGLVVRKQGFDRLRG